MTTDAEHRPLVYVAIQTARFERVPVEGTTRVGLRDVVGLHRAWTEGLVHAGLAVIPPKDYRHSKYAAMFSDLAAAGAIVVVAADETDMPGIGEVMSAIAGRGMARGDFDSCEPCPVFVQFIDGDMPSWWTNQIGDRPYQMLSADLDTAVAEVATALRGNAGE